jgi:Putative outer membrane beta-barrel porin, MtrB/PioB
MKIVYDEVHQSASQSSRTRTPSAPRSKLLALMIGLIVASLAPTSVLANSGDGVDTSTANWFNLAGTSSKKEKDPDGLGIQEYTRSPTGFLVTRPYLPVTPNKTEYGWLQSGSIELGGFSVSGTNKDSAKFREYRDLRNGGTVASFDLQMEQTERAYFVDAFGGALGRDDQYAALNFGQYNSWKVKSFYNETPHVFTNQYRSLWSGVGTGNLTLNGLRPGGTTNAATTDINIGNAALVTPFSSLSLSRKKGGVRLDMRFFENWNVFASYTGEQRQGARPFGLVSGAGGGTGGVETPETIDYHTHDFAGGLQYSDTLNSFNLTASSSLFRNNVSTLSIENPLFVAPANGLTLYPRAVFDLYPSNDFHNVKGEYSRALPNFMRGYFTVLLSSSQSKQNEGFIPYTPYAGAVVNGVNGGGWDTLAALSRQSAGAKIDSKLADVSLSLKPFSGLDLKAKARLYETSNGLEYLVCNPLTGQWGRLINDGSGAAIINTAAYLVPGVRCNIAATAALNVVPSGGNINIRAIPWEYKQRNYTLSGDHRLGRAQNLSLTYEREEFDRAYRERAETNEDKIKLGYVNRALEKGTIRISLENDRRRGSTYNPDPYGDFYSVALGPLPTANGTAGNPWIRTNDLHRKYDLADRDQNIVNARFNYMVAPDMDIGASLQAKDIKYPGVEYGRKDSQRLNSASLDFNWQPSHTFGFYANYSFQSGTMNQAGLQPNACVIGTSYNFLSDGSVQTTPLTPAQTTAGLSIVASRTVLASNFQSLCGTVSPTSPLYPTSRTWVIDHRDKNHTATIGGNFNFSKVRLDANYTYTQANTAVRYGYNAAALGLSPAQVALAGDGFPDLLLRKHTVEFNAIAPITNKFSLRFLCRYETGKFRDWHYDGIAQNPTPNTNQATFLDSGPQGYKATVIGVFMTLAL